MKTFSLSFGRLPSKTVKCNTLHTRFVLRSLKGIWILYFSGSNCWNLVEGIFLSSLITLELEGALSKIKPLHLISSKYRGCLTSKKEIVSKKTPCTFVDVIVQSMTGSSAFRIALALIIELTQAAKEQRKMRKLIKASISSLGIKFFREKNTSLTWYKETTDNAVRSKIRRVSLITIFFADIFFLRGLFSFLNSTLKFYYFLRRTQSPSPAIQG